MHRGQAISLARNEKLGGADTQVTRTKLVRPVLNQTRGTCNDALLDRRLSSARRLFEEGPHESNALESLNGVNSARSVPSGGIC